MPSWLTDLIVTMFMTTDNVTAAPASLLSAHTSHVALVMTPVMIFLYLVIISDSPHPGSPGPQMLPDHRLPVAVHFLVTPGPGEIRADDVMRQ